MGAYKFKIIKKGSIQFDNKTLHIEINKKQVEIYRPIMLECIPQSRSTIENGVVLLQGLDLLGCVKKGELFWALF